MYPTSQVHFLMIRESELNLTEVQKATPRRTWVRFVILAQCLAVFVLIAVVIVVSGVFDGNESGGNLEADSALAEKPREGEKDSVSKPVVSAPIATSSIARIGDVKPRPVETPANNAPAKPQPIAKTGNTKSVESKPTEEPKGSPPEREVSPRPKVDNPLKQLPQTLDTLSTLASRNEMTVGPLTVPKDVRLDIEMHGGATAHRVKIRETDEASDKGRKRGLGQQANEKDNRVEYDGVPTFQLKETFDDAGNTYWIVDLTDYRGTIAKIWLENGDLRFQWTENSSRYKESGFLANCVLLVSIPDWGRVHSLALRKPVKAKPATIDFVRGTATTEYAIQFMPPDVTLTVETVGATKSLPKPTVGIDRWLSTDRDFVYLKFGDGAPLVVKVLASTQYTDKQPRIITASYFSLSRVADNLPGTLSKLASARSRTERTIQLLQQRAASAKKRRELDRDIRSYQTQLKQIKWLEGITKSSQKQRGIVFRIIHSADGHTLDLVHGGL